ncbi:type II toxin-antitoxin system RelE family toxin [Evansella tamaricis]|uniref:Type II toxin-antitoxin system RelE/ParE family toxin n=1 Tax=Evansella tamaricis TaxID=2069301 RepID=A0ABS6JIE5_9BACI|nr:type II toxin-antitoxin system RelE/ParE family toxin [Evansella tamaricis]
MLTLAENPYQRGISRYKFIQRCRQCFFRLRVNDFRIVYEVKETELIIFIIAAGSSGDIYK